MEPKTEPPELFRGIDVWQRRNATEVICYRCFQSLSTGKYSVQSRDYYHLPLDAERVARLNRQYLELLIEVSPSERAEAFDSLEDAITDHVQSFANFWSEGFGIDRDL